MNLWPSEFFSREEFACKCGCGLDKVDAELLNILNLIRKKFGRTSVSSGCRCPTYNAKIGGAEDSRHIHCDAADITCENGTPKEVADYAEELGVDGIGRYRGWTHIDTRGFKARWGSN